MIGKTYFSQVIFYIVLATILFVRDLAVFTKAYAQQQFVPPSQITLQMHALDSEGRLDSSLPDTRCYSVVANRTRYGCTSIIGDLNNAYPFDSDSITLYFESHLINGIQQGYLHNVTPGEVAINVSSQGNKPLSCVGGQAIASRTYAYYNIQQGAAINNSSQFQVYVPYKYAQLTLAQQRRVDESVSEVLYMTTPDSTNPIRAHFGADNDSTTTDGGESYLKSVYDPISHLGKDEGTGNGGMSSRGCSRWSFGHTSSRGPVASGNSNYPHDNQGDGDFWSVRYDNAKQILSQYYSHMVIRNASGQIVTPAWRWNPLSVDWGNESFNPPPMQANHTYNVIIQLHNSGIKTWTNDTLLSYQWQSGSDTINGTTSVSVGSVAPGNYTSVTMPVRTPGDSGNYTLRIDMIHADGSYFHNRESGRSWFTLDFDVCVGNKCHLTFLPFIATSDGSSLPPPSGCVWKIDNLLEDAGINYSQNTTPWQQINTLNGEDGAIKPLSSLRTSEESLPGDSPYSAFLGKWNDPDHSSNDVSDQAIYQQITLPDNIVAVAIEYSSRLTTYETTDSEEYDKFFVDLQVGGLGSNSLLAARQPKYTNLYPYKDTWRRRGVAVEDGGDGLLIVNNMSRHAGKAIILVFYSEVNASRPSTFYIDAVKLKGCVR